MQPGVGQGKPQQDTRYVILNTEAARRVVAATRRVEDSFRNRPPTRGLGFRGYMLPSAWFKTTSSVSARSSATYGSGSAKMQGDSGTAFLDNGITVTLYNGTDKVIASGAYVLAVFAMGKWWAAVPGSCSNLS